MTYLQKPSGITQTPNALGKRAVTRRSQLEIRMDILRAIMEGAEGPTQIMYKANLSWILLCDHLGALNEQGFVGEKTVGNRKKYSLTGKGIEIVGAYLNLIREIIFDTAVAPM
jgi:predicted transcriptional regulator